MSQDTAEEKKKRKSLRFSAVIMAAAWSYDHGPCPKGKGKVLKLRWIRPDLSKTELKQHRADCWYNQQTCMLQDEAEQRVCRQLWC